MKFKTIILTILFLVAIPVLAQNGGVFDPPNSANPNFYYDDEIKIDYNAHYMRTKFRGLPEEEKVQSIKCTFICGERFVYVAEFRQIENLENNPWCPWLGKWNYVGPDKDKIKIFSYRWSDRQEGDLLYFIIPLDEVYNFPDSLIRIKAIKVSEWDNYVNWANNLKDYVD